MVWIGRRVIGRVELCCESLFVFGWGCVEEVCGGGADGLGMHAATDTASKDQDVGDTHTRHTHTRHSLGEVSGRCQLHPVIGGLVEGRLQV